MEKWRGRPVGSGERENTRREYRNTAQEPGAPARSPADFVFGIQSVLETLRSGKEIDKLLVQRELGNLEVLEFARLRGIPVQKVPTEKLDRLTRKNHQGVIAFVAAVNYAKLENVVADVFERGLTPLILLLDRVTDVRNFGAIARTAECTGVQAIVVPVKGGAQINADAMKTSSGALNFLPVCREVSLAQTVRYLQESGIQVVGCTEKVGKTIYEIDFTLPTALILGSEEDGISDELLRLADELASIPIQGRVGSLNVSVANGVALYEAIRQRML
ncbi:MAG: 23S rRNA (guanosine(2251)-2'-O)-methyltransferase RlmB [Cytophagaceae bacterium]|nr:23S rRNA (guanosine(2251)-2'-O)-methyltransferase RlmB [Cytophagaceae bacterium]